MVVLARLWPPVQSDQLNPIGADLSTATSLSLSIYNLLLYGESFGKRGESLGEEEGSEG